jgi:hypothetical protein
MSRQRTPGQRAWVDTQIMTAKWVSALALGLPYEEWKLVCSRSLRLGHPGREAGPQSQGSPGDSLAVEGADAGSPHRLTLVKSKEWHMFRLRLATALIAVLALTACTEADNLTAPTGTGTRDTPVPGGPRTGQPGGTSGGGDTTSTNPGDTTSTNPGDTTSTNPADTAGAGDPVSNGTWTTPDGEPTTIQPVNDSIFDATGSGSAGTSGSSTALVFKTSGTGIYGVGTCGPNGLWTDVSGNVFGPNNPNCLDYGSDGSPGNNGNGQCIASASGQPGLWVNPGGHETHPFHSKCIRVGPTTTSLELSFAPQAQIFDATDGSGSRVMNFYSESAVVAQLLYDGNTGTTTGAGLLIGGDNVSQDHIWTVFFGQPSLSFSGGLANGDLIDEMTSGGIEVVACSTTLGCSLVTLQVTLGS